MLVVLYSHNQDYADFKRRFSSTKEQLQNKTKFASSLSNTPFLYRQYNLLKNGCKESTAAGASAFEGA